jgi:GNAT superfamily N-acetyltransferase
MMKVLALTGGHARNEFDCGVEVLNLWLQQTALQHQAKGISRTFVAVPASVESCEAYRSAGYADVDESSVLGYYALASACVLIEEMPTRFAKRYPRQIPVTRLGRLAVRADLQGQGLGRLLLADAVSRARKAALSVGSAGLFVDAKDEGAARFYAQYGFAPCSEQALKLYLPMW